jgi:hypothetical protein
MTRTRTSSFAWHGGGTKYHKIAGTYVLNSTQAAYSPYVRSICQDFTGKGSDHPLDIQHIDLSGITPLNGVHVSGDHEVGFHDWMPDFNTAPPVPILPSGLPSASVVATATLARSNPSVPVVSMPNFIYELKDLPGMLHDIGRLKLLRHANHKQFDAVLATRANDPKAYANGFLSYRMGWSPLIGDLRKMLTFQDAINNRIKDLDVLFNQNGGLHRTVGKELLPGVSKKHPEGRPGSWTETLTSSGTLTIDSSTSASISVHRDLVTTRKMWGSVRWTNAWTLWPRLCRAELEAKARDLVTGYNVTPKMIWDAVPWTWLIDWFGNFGDYLNATNNMLALTPSIPNVMLWERTTDSWTRSDSNQDWCSGGYGTRVVEHKVRSQTTASLSAVMPIFSDDHFATLGALALQRMR